MRKFQVARIPSSRAVKQKFKHPKLKPYTVVYLRKLTWYTVFLAWVCNGTHLREVDGIIVKLHLVQVSGLGLLEGLDAGDILVAV